MKKRDLYLNQLIVYKDKPVIKVITGIRRCGKSSLLTLFEEYLHNAGISTELIIRMNFESFEFDEIRTYRELYKFIENKIINKKEKNYIIIDEVQLVQDWEKCINALLVDFNVDIYITGSNAYLLSSELSTLISGRYVEIKMQPLSFKEFIDFVDTDQKSNHDELFSQYLEFGGLPAISDFLDVPESTAGFLSGIYNTVIMKDVIQRNEIRDPALLENVVKFLAANVGNIVSAKKISDYLTSTGRKTRSDTIDNYVRMLENAYIFYRAKRYDLKGKQILKTYEKLYIVDTGIRNQLTGLRNKDFGHILENVIYFELLCRGYEVYIGKTDSLEIDFIATKSKEKMYIQVSASILDEGTKARELRPLLTIHDSYPKYILTMDRTGFTDIEGIKVINIIDFLLEKNSAK